MQNEKKIPRREGEFFQPIMAPEAQLKDEDCMQEKTVASQKECNNRKIN